MARVAANSLDIVRRECQWGAATRQYELTALQDFYQSQAELEQLRWRLVTALRDLSQSLDCNELQVLLRQTVANQIGIDQPAYSGLKHALSNVGELP